MVTKKKINIWLNDKKISRSAFIVYNIGLFYFIFIQTSIFGDLNDLVKVGIYMMIATAMILTGMSFISVKKLAEKIEGIYNNPTMKKSQKLNTLMGIALNVLGTISEIYDDDNGIIPLEKEIPELPKIVEPTPEPTPETQE